MLLVRSPIFSAIGDKITASLLFLQPSGSLRSFRPSCPSVCSTSGTITTRQFIAHIYWAAQLPTSCWWRGVYLHCIPVVPSLQQLSSSLLELSKLSTPLSRIASKLKHVKAFPPSSILDWNISQRCLLGQCHLRISQVDQYTDTFTLRSLKDLSKSIAASAANLALPLPSDLSQVINAYLDKHAVYDDGDSQRLQEELLTIYQVSILDHPTRLAPFVAILRNLKPNIRGSGRLLQWWDRLSGPIIINLGVEKGLAFETRDILLGILIYDEEEEEHLKDAKASSAAVAENLMSTWLAKSKLALDELNEHARFVESQIQLILLAFGKRRPTVSSLRTIEKSDANSY